MRALYAGLLPILPLLLVGCARNSVAEPPRAEGQAVAVAQAPNAPPPIVPSNERFAFQADKGGELMSQTVRPAEHLRDIGADASPGPRPLPVPPGMMNPAVTLPATVAAPVPAPGPKAPVLRPHTPGEGTPLTAYRQPPAVPALPELATGSPIAVVGRDVNLPAPLGFLGLPVPDRVPLDDPTVDASVQAALMGPPAPRDTPIPFVPQNLPDPFVNAQAVRLHAPPPEGPIPVSGPIRTPPVNAPPPKP